MSSTIYSTKIIKDHNKLIFKGDTIVIDFLYDFITYISKDSLFNEAFNLFVVRNIGYLDGSD